MALVQDRAIQRREGVTFTDPIAADTRIWKGSLTCLDASGNLIPGQTATGLTARGVCTGGSDSVGDANNTGGAAGDQTGNSRPGCYPFKNSASTDQITRAEIGDDCYIVDDETVAKTSGSSTRSIAGKVVDIDNYGVWVSVGV